VGRGCGRRYEHLHAGSAFEIAHEIAFEIAHQRRELDAIELAVRVVVVDAHKGDGLGLCRLEPDEGRNQTSSKEPSDAIQTQSVALSRTQT
jgi:hypothetical protein